MSLPDTGTIFDSTIDLNLNKTGISLRQGFFFSKSLIQDNSESLVDVPVAQTAKIVPSFCSCIDFGLVSAFAFGGVNVPKNDVFILETSEKRIF